MTESTITLKTPRLDLAWALGICAVCMLPPLCFLAEPSGLSAYLALALACAGGAMFLAASRKYFGKYTLVGLFAALASAHAVVGFLLAGPTTGAIPVDTNLEPYYSISFLVVAAGLFAASLGYRSSVSTPHTRVRRWCDALNVDETRFLRYSRWMVIAGSVLMAVVFSKLGFLPVLSEAPGQARYITPEVSDTFLQDEWIMSRAIDLLSVSLLVVLSSAWWCRRRADIVVAAIGVVAIAMPLRRGTLASLIVGLMIMQVLRTGQIPRRYIVVLCLLALTYAATNVIFFNLLGKELTTSNVVNSAGSGFPEIRDLGWMISLSKTPWYGATFLQATLPVPSFVSDFSVRNSLREITSRLIGFEQRESGGLRLTLPGESYLNFGFFGVSLIGYAYGLICGNIDSAMHRLQAKRQLAALFVATALFLWFCFWLHLGGTQAAATIKVGSFLVALLFIASWNRQPKPPAGDHGLRNS